MRRRRRARRRAGPPNPAPTAAQIIVTPPATEFRVAGGPYTVPISINNASRLSAITLTVTYNPAVLRVRTVQDGTFMRQGGVTASFTPRHRRANGRVDIAIARTSDQTGASGAGLLAALLFDAIAPGTSAIAVTGVANAPDGHADRADLRAGDGDGEVARMSNVECRMPKASRREGLGHSRSRRSREERVSPSSSCSSSATILLILASAVMPLARVSIQRQREAELRRALREMRTAIDKFKDAADAGGIASFDVKAGSEDYPPSLETLVEGVTKANDATGVKLKFLRRIPDRSDDAQSTEWGMRAYGDKPDSTAWGGGNVFDVYTKVDRQGARWHEIQGLVARPRARASPSSSC